MLILETIAVAFGMFSAVPVPQPTWNEKNMRYMLCAFPLIGVVIGCMLMMWSALSNVLAMPELLRGAGFCLIPVLVTGGIHLDGYADTSDALSSYGSPEKKHEILKDPHCGAFAVIRLTTYMLAYFALCTAVDTEDTGIMLVWALSFVLSRALSGFAVARFRIAKDTGLAQTFALSADRTRVKNVLIIFASVCILAILALGKASGAAMTAAALLVLLRYRSVSMKQFGGISGDLAGWFLQNAELWMLAALVAAQLIGGAI